MRARSRGSTERAAISSGGRSNENSETRTCASYLLDGPGATRALARTAPRSDHALMPSTRSGAVRVQALLVLAALVKRFRFLPEPGFSPELFPSVTLRSANGIHIRAEARSDETA